ncbi:MAG: sulfatase [Armatimonadota bacterium]
MAKVKLVVAGVAGAPYRKRSGQERGPATQRRMVLVGPVTRLGPMQQSKRYSALRLAGIGPLLVLVSLVGAVGITGCRLHRKPAADSKRAAARALVRAHLEKFPNVIIIVLDAARADHFGCYGYPRDTTPNIDRLAKESLVFEQHFCDFPRTAESTVSLFTGRYAADFGYHGGSRSLASRLRALGFVAESFTQHSFPPLQGALGSVGITQNANPRPLSAPKSGHWGKPTDLAVRFRRRFSRRQDRASPLFVYLHMLPPHTPYDAPKEFQQLFAGRTPPGTRQGDYPFPQVKPEKVGGGGLLKVLGLREWVNQYDANLRWADFAVGQLVKTLRELDRLDDTILIVTADHGEAFGEHGYQGHVRCVYDEMVHIPLVMRLPGKRLRGRISALTQTVDIAPTILELLGANTEDAPIQGQSLVPLIAKSSPRVREAAFAFAGGIPQSSLVRTQEWALILYEGGELRALYNLKRDPGETRNVIAQHPREARELADEFRRFASSLPGRPLQFVDSSYAVPPQPEPKQRSLTADERQQIRALGYTD